MDTSAAVAAAAGANPVSEEYWAKACGNKRYLRRVVDEVKDFEHFRGTLILNDCYLLEIPSGFLQWLGDRGIKELTIANNRVFDVLAGDMSPGGDFIVRKFNLCDELDKVPGLTHLRLRACNLKAVPTSVNCLKNLVELHIDGNNGLQQDPDNQNPGLHQIPSLDGLTALKVLSLSDNALHAAPPGLEGLRSLTWLNLSHNEIGSLPPEIGRMQALAVLNLAANRIAELPDEVFNLSELKELDLSENRLADEFPGDV